MRPGGVLAYATCSLLPPENDERVAAFLERRPDFEPLPMSDAWQATIPAVPPDGVVRDTALLLSPRRTQTDGFFLALLRRKN